MLQALKICFKYTKHASSILKRKKRKEKKRSKRKEKKKKKNIICFPNEF